MYNGVYTPSFANDNTEHAMKTKFPYTGNLELESGCHWSAIAQRERFDVAPDNTVRRTYFKDKSKDVPIFYVDPYSGDILPFVCSLPTRQRCMFVKRDLNGLMYFDRNCLPEIYFICHNNQISKFEWKGQDLEILHNMEEYSREGLKYINQVCNYDEVIKAEYAQLYPSLAKKIEERFGADSFVAKRKEEFLRRMHAHGKQVTRAQIDGDSRFYQYGEVKGMPPEAPADPFASYNANTVNYDHNDTKPHIPTDEFGNIVKPKEKPPLLEIPAVYDRGLGYDYMQHLLDGGDAEDFVGEDGKRPTKVDSNMLDKMTKICERNEEAFKEMNQREYVFAPDPMAQINYPVEEPQQQQYNVIPPTQPVTQQQATQQQVAQPTDSGIDPKVYNHLDHRYSPSPVDQIKEMAKNLKVALGDTPKYKVGWTMLDDIMKKEQKFAEDIRDLRLAKHGDSIMDLVEDELDYRLMDLIKMVCFATGITQKQLEENTAYIRNKLAADPHDTSILNEVKPAKQPEVVKAPEQAPAKQPEVTQQAPAEFVRKPKRSFSPEAIVTDGSSMLRDFNEMEAEELSQSFDEGVDDDDTFDYHQFMPAIPEEDVDAELDALFGPEEDEDELLEDKEETSSSDSEEPECSFNSAPTLRSPVLNVERTSYHEVNEMVGKSIHPEVAGYNLLVPNALIGPKEEVYWVLINETDMIPCWLPSDAYVLPHNDNKINGVVSYDANEKTVLVTVNGTSVKEILVDNAMLDNYEVSENNLPNSSVILLGEGDGFYEDILNENTDDLFVGEEEVMVEDKPLVGDISEIADRAVILSKDASSLPIWNTSVTVPMGVVYPDSMLESLEKHIEQKGENDRGVQLLSQLIGRATKAGDDFGAGKLDRLFTDYLNQFALPYLNVSVASVDNALTGSRDFAELKDILMEENKDALQKLYILIKRDFADIFAGFKARRHELDDVPRSVAVSANREDLDELLDDHGKYTVFTDCVKFNLPGVAISGVLSGITTGVLRKSNQLGYAAIYSAYNEIKELDTYVSSFLVFTSQGTFRVIHHDGEFYLTTFSA